MTNHHLEETMTTNHKRALIVVDVQNDFTDEEKGTLYVPDGEQIAARIGNALRGDVTRSGNINRDDYALIVTTQDWHVNPGDHFSDTPDYVDSWPVHCKANTWGAELHPALTAVGHLPGAEGLEPRIDRAFFKGQYAASYSGFDASDGDAGLGEYLLQAGITDVDVVGVATDYCVKATALDAVKYGFNTRVIPWLVAEVHNDALPGVIKELTDAGVKTPLKIRSGSSISLGLLQSKQRRGYFKQQPHGPGNSLRKTVWVDPS